VMCSPIRDPEASTLKVPTVVIVSVLVGCVGHYGAASVVLPSEDSSVPPSELSSRGSWAVCSRAARGAKT